MGELRRTDLRLAQDIVKANNHFECDHCRAHLKRRVRCFCMYQVQVWLGKWTDSQRSILSKEAYKSFDLQERLLTTKDARTDRNRGALHGYCYWFPEPKHGIMPVLSKLLVIPRLFGFRLSTAGVSRTDWRCLDNGHLQWVAMSYLSLHPDQDEHIGALHGNQVRQIWMLHEVGTVALRMR